jgi:hypothetical protein
VPNRMKILLLHHLPLALRERRRSAFSLGTKLEDSSLSSRVHFHLPHQPHRYLHIEQNNDHDTCLVLGGERVQKRVILRNKALVVLKSRCLRASRPPRWQGHLPIMRSGLVVTRRSTETHLPRCDQGSREYAQQVLLC